MAHRQVCRFFEGILRDFLGNYYNNVSTPKKYFNEKSFNDLLELSNSEIVEKKLNIKVYQSYFLFMSSPKLNFIYLYSKINYY